MQVGRIQQPHRDGHDPLQKAPQLAEQQVHEAVSAADQVQRDAERDRGDGLGTRRKYEQLLIQGDRPCAAQLAPQQ